MGKDKKKKAKKAGKADKSSSATAVDKLKALTENPLVADIVAAALVATASALKDSKRARALASDAGDELDKLAKAGAERGNAMWDMALEIGRRSIEAITSEQHKPEPKPKSTAAAGKTKPAKKAKSASKKKSASASKS